MTFSQRLRHSRAGLLLLVSALLVSLIPIRAVEAREQLKDLDNTVAEFVGGNFQRASANNYQSTDDSTDQKGAVQLATAGTLKFKNNASSSTLPVKLQAMGSTVIGNHIYVIGGIGPSGRVATVYSTRVDLDNGSLPDGWVTEPALNQQSGSANFPTATAPVSFPGVASATVGGSSYIYVIGGNAAFGANDFSSYAVRYAKVGSDGHIVDTSTSTTDGWQPLPGGNIPQSDPTDAGSQLGLQSAAVTTFTVPETGITYVYILGGLQRTLVGSGGNTKLVNAGSRTIFVARVGTNGVLFKANSSGDTTANQGWQRLDLQIPVAESDIPDVNADSRAYRGVWDGVAVADRFPASTDPTYTDAIFLMGGQLAPATGTASATYSNKVFEFYIAANGQLVSSSNQAIMPDARRGHSGVELGGSIYLTGGIPNSTTDPDRVVATSKITGTLALTRYGGDGAPNFLTNTDGLPQPRAFHATALVKNNAGAAYIYILGGRGANDADPTDDNGSDQVYYTQLNTDETITAGYVSDGWYYSKSFNLNTTAVDVREINWSTFYSVTGMNVRVEFRVSGDSNCALLQNSRTVAWQTLDSGAGAGISTNGFNKVEKTGINGRCFQYRAFLTTLVTTGSFPTTTPLLLKFSVKIVVPGSADLKVSKINQNKQGDATTGVSAGITNHNDTQPTSSNPTLAADIDGGGSFFVDLFVFEGTPVTPTLPLNDETLASANHVGCAQIPNSAMTPSTVYTVTQWLDPTCTSPITVTAIFPKQNTVYTVMVAVDTGCPNNKIADVFYGCINEVDATNGENNNISSVRMTVAGTKDVPIGGNGSGIGPIALPLISRK